jgi:large repetitive protein
MSRASFLGRLIRPARRPESRPARRSRLGVEALEDRVVPAGNVTAALSSTGLLSITGDDADNVFTLQVTGADVTLTPDASTQINGKAAGTPVTLTGAARTLKASLKEGDDSIAIVNTADFVLTRGAAFDLGEGNNTLDLSTTGRIGLGSLAVKAGDGNDTVTVRGGLGDGSTIATGATFDLGAGAVNLVLGDDAGGFGELSIPGRGGVRVTGSTGGTVTAKSLTVARSFKTAIGATSQTTFTNCTLGGLSQTGDSITSNLYSTAVTGNMTAAASGFAEVFGYGLAVTGDVRVSSSGHVAGLVAFDGGLSARNAAVSADYWAIFGSMTGPVTLTGNLTISSPSQIAVLLNTAAPSEVHGNVTVNGGWQQDSFNVSPTFKADGNVVLNLGEGDNVVTIGAATATTDIGGNLVLQSGAGNDAITLQRVAVTGLTSITTGAGNDTLTIDNGSAFTGTFLADTGSGNDIISIAQSAGAPAPVTFTGKATILAGAGNDTLQLGRPEASGGDANSQALFVAAGSKVDGGSGNSTFDDEAGQFSGIALGTGLIHWADPTP